MYKKCSFVLNFDFNTQTKLMAQTRTFDFSIELMELCSLYEDTTLYNKVSDRARLQMEWSQTKMSRVLNGSSVLLPAEAIVCEQAIKEVKTLGVKRWESEVYNVVQEDVLND